MFVSFRYTVKVVSSSLLHYLNLHDKKYIGKSAAYSFRHVIVYVFQITSAKHELITRAYAYIYEHTHIYTCINTSIKYFHQLIEPIRTYIKVSLCVNGFYAFGYMLVS